MLSFIVCARLPIVREPRLAPPSECYCCRNTPPSHAPPNPQHSPPPPLLLACLVCGSRDGTTHPPRPPERRHVCPTTTTPSELLLLLPEEERPAQQERPNRLLDRSSSVVAHAFPAISCPPAPAFRADVGEGFAMWEELDILLLTLYSFVARVSPGRRR